MDFSWCTVSCYICGREGYNPRAHESWLGVQFRCKNGCHPSDIRAFQKKKQKEKEKRERERTLVCSNVSHI